MNMTKLTNTTQTQIHGCVSQYLPWGENRPLDDAYSTYNCMRLKSWVKDIGRQNFQIENVKVFDEVKLLMNPGQGSKYWIYNTTRLYADMRGPVLPGVQAGRCGAACEGAGPLPGLHLQLCLHAYHDGGGNGQQEICLVNNAILCL